MRKFLVMFAIVLALFAGPMLNYEGEVAAHDPIVRALLVDEIHTFLGNTNKEGEFINLVNENNITELTFYTGGPVEKRIIPQRNVQFDRFLRKVLKQTRVKTMGVAVGSIQEIDRVNAFARRYRIKWSAYWLEYEWWNNQPRDFDTAKVVLRYARTKAPKAKIGAYIGWVLKSEMIELAQLCDRIFIHSYAANADTLYARVSDRLHFLDGFTLPASKKRIEIMPIFSAEWRPLHICQQGKRAPGFYNQMCFSGPWISRWGMQSIERKFMKDMRADTPVLHRTPYTKNWRHSAKFTGFYYFAYTHLKDALK